VSPERRLRQEKRLRRGNRVRVLGVLRIIKKILPHPLWRIAIATLNVISGRGELLLRSYGLLLIVFWLAVELWVWLLEKPTIWKQVFGRAVCDAMLIAMMGDYVALVRWKVAGSTGQRIRKDDGSGIYHIV